MRSRMKIRPTWLCLCLAIVLCASAEARGIKGNVRLSTGEPAAGVIVLVFSVEDLVLKEATTTDEDGRFELRADSGGSSDNVRASSYPNPFNPETTIEYTVVHDGAVRIQVYNSVGQLVRRLVDDEWQMADRQTVVWDGRDDRGRVVGNGVYLYVVESPGRLEKGKLTLLDGAVTQRAQGLYVRPSAIARRLAVVVVGDAVETEVVERPGLGGNGRIDVVVKPAQAPGSPRALAAENRPGVVGDVNGDGEVNLSDALIVATAAIVGSVNLPEGGDLSLGDVNDDMRIDMSDALAIASYAFQPDNPSLPSGIGTRFASQEGVVRINLRPTEEASARDLLVVSPVGVTRANESGETAAPTVQGLASQFVPVVDESGELVLLGYVRPTHPDASSITRELGSTETAKALVLLSPLLLGLTDNLRQEIAQRVPQHAQFSELVRTVDQALQVGNLSRTSEGSATEIQLTATRIALDVVGELAGSGKAIVGHSDGVPWVEDLEGNDVALKNPNHVYYGWVVSEAPTMAPVARGLLSPRDAFFELLRWPPIKISDEAMSPPIPLGSGGYSILMTRGLRYPLEQLVDLDSPVGVATVANVELMVVHVLDLFLGFGRNSTLNLKLPGTALTGLNRAILDRDLSGLFGALVGVILSNVDKIGSAALKQVGGTESVTRYMEILLPQLHGAALALKALNASNTAFFFYDFLTAPVEVEYRVRQESGIVNVDWNAVEEAFLSDIRAKPVDYHGGRNFSRTQYREFGGFRFIDLPDDVKSRLNDYLRSDEYQEILGLELSTSPDNPPTEEPEEPPEESLGEDPTEPEPEPEYLIAFESDRGGNEDIYTIRPDGSGLLRVTTQPRDDGSPSWSHGRDQLAFRGGSVLRIAGPTGEGERILTATNMAQRVAWSPDDSRIAFGLATGISNIWIIDTDGGNRRIVTQCSDHCAEPSWSPDGQRIAYSSRGDIYSVDPDGSAVVNLTSTRMFDESSPVWSPDGQRIAFTARAFSGPDPNSFHIYVMESDGGHPLRLTSPTGSVSQLVK